MLCLCMKCLSSWCLVRIPSMLSCKMFRALPLLCGCVLASGGGGGGGEGGGDGGDGAGGGNEDECGVIGDRTCVAC